MKLTRVPPFTTVHGVKEHAPDSVKATTLETWCGKFPDPTALPTLEGELADINCTVCRRSSRFKQARYWETATLPA